MCGIRPGGKSGGDEKVWAQPRRMQLIKKGAEKKKEDFRHG